jgi:hypothetical protein
MKKLTLFLVIVLISVPCIQSQDEEKIQALFKNAIEAMGGDTYLKAVDMVAEGQRFYFNSSGESSGLFKFVDYTKFPDKSRFELGNRKNDLDITIFNLEKNEGWIQEGQKEIRDAKPDEMKEFRDSIKHSIDSIFRFRYKDPANKLFYLGSGDGHEITLESVKLLDSDNDEVTIYIDRLTNLPAKIEYRKINDRGVRQRVVEEYSQWLVFQGIKTPLRIDGFVNGRRLFQHFIIKVSYNNNLADSIFSKPVRQKK